MTVMGRPDWRTWRPAATLGDNKESADLFLFIWAAHRRQAERRLEASTELARCASTTTSRTIVTGTLMTVSMHVIICAELHVLPLKMIRSSVDVGGDRNSFALIAAC